MSVFVRTPFNPSVNYQKKIVIWVARESYLETVAAVGLCPSMPPSLHLAAVSQILYEKCLFTICIQLFTGAKMQFLYKAPQFSCYNVLLLCYYFGLCNLAPNVQFFHTIQLTIYFCCGCYIHVLTYNKLYSHYILPIYIIPYNMTELTSYFLLAASLPFFTRYSQKTT